MSDERYIKLLTEINKYGLDKGCAVEVMAVHNATGQTVKQLCGMHEKEVLQQLIEGYLFQKEQRSKLEAENAALRERLEKAIEPPCERDDIFYRFFQYPAEMVEDIACGFRKEKDGELYVCSANSESWYNVKECEFSREAAEARLNELKGEKE